MLSKKARWITSPDEPDNGAVELSKVFTLDTLPETASLSVCGLGFSETLINGRPVTDRLLTPPFTAYDKRVYYETYPVAGLLKKGENRIDITLGAGWFRETAPDAWEFEHSAWRAPLTAIVTLTDGDGNELLVTDLSWKARPSRLVFSQLREGETYDASIEEAEWKDVILGRSPGGVVEEYNGPGIEIEEVLEPVSSVKVAGGVVYDFGVNLAGGCEVTFRGEKGAKISLAYSERVKEDGSMDRQGIKGLVLVDRFQKDIYVCSGDGVETRHNRFTYNGFRYVFVEGDAELISISARCYHTSLPEAGGFECDVPVINDIEKALLRSTKTNFHHIPTDCPHREKNGWTGDAHLSSEQALFHFDIVPAYRKWLRDLSDCQRPNGAVPCICPTSIWGYNWGSGVTWDCAVVEIPWQIWLATGDDSVLSEHYGMMKRYTEFMLATADADGISRIGLGDWCAPSEARAFPTEALLTAVSVDVLDKMAKIAGLVSPEDAEGYREKAEFVRLAFRSEFGNTDCHSQTYDAMLLRFRLTEKPDEIAKRLARTVRDDGCHVVCGIFGVKFVFDALTDAGYFDLAWEMATKRDYPSFALMLENGGGTLWEDWTGSNSLNHHMFSPIGAWFVRGIAGIRITEAGYKSVLIAPHVPAEMNRFKAWHDTPLGRLTVEYLNGELTVTAPADMKVDVEFGGTSKIVRIVRI